MDEKEKELTEVPLSNREVLKVLKARIQTGENGEKHHPRTLEMVEYLETVEKGPYNFPLETLRNISKNLSSDITTLAILSNISDDSIVNASDRKRIKQHLTKINKR